MRIYGVFKLHTDRTFRLIKTSLTPDNLNYTKNKENCWKSGIAQIICYIDSPEFWACNGFGNEFSLKHTGELVCDRVSNIDTGWIIWNGYILTRTNGYLEQDLWEEYNNGEKTKDYYILKW